MSSHDAFPTSAPRALRDPDVLRKRLRAVRTEPAVRPLNDWVEKLRGRLGVGEAVPWFDPACGRVGARSLFLLEAPGQKSMGAEVELRRTGSGIISVDNDDQTAQNCWTLRAEAGLPYHESVHWNVVPWYLGSADRVAAPKRTEIQGAAPFLHEVIAMVPALEVVVPGREVFWRRRVDAAVRSGSLFQW
ncbi:uracil-DNA glycosylase [Streptomyces cylindrosporus]|uniref:Uracil-DNA glycosylase n=1 Tax=Streptomyces cylindrosporus TaxID=2927583 RepID=A0ABS9YHK7_9ACTN|nr:uracil-DNA glycosylase [Streptomyces cylindrosporus]MCI3276732.1 uracil-DNA glycosylase [Streptomyces cylindrosporus]